MSEIAVRLASDTRAEVSTTSNIDPKIAEHNGRIGMTCAAWMIFYSTEVRG
jgi:hypothetical protein